MAILIEKLNQRKIKKKNIIKMKKKIKFIQKINIYQALISDLNYFFNNIVNYYITIRSKYF